MTTNPRIVRCVLALVVVVEFLFAGTAISEITPPDTLNKLWEQQMLEGKPSRIHVTVQGSTIEISEDSPKKTLTTVKNDSPVWLNHEPYGINVNQTGEGFWGNGGCSLLGGLLDEVSIGPSRIQLYAKIVEHYHSHFIVPFLFHRHTPRDTGYEFFLLHRKQGIPGAKIIRTWVFSPDEVVLEANRHGWTDSDVRAAFQLDSTSRTATVRVRGLKKPFEERVDLTSELEGAPQKPSESDRVNQ